MMGLAFAVIQIVTVIRKNTKMASKPTQRTLALLKKEGYTVTIGEKYNAFIKIRQDLFGWIDVVAIHPEKSGVLGVQTTSGSNLTARIKKATALDSFKVWVKAGNAVEFHGWRKLKNLPGNRQWACDRRDAKGVRIEKEKE